jgi:hypothetical protein
MFWNQKKSSSETPQVMLVRNETRNSIIASTTNIADSGAKRRKGLLGRSELPPGHGLWIVPCEAIHTCGMKFPIDVVYLNRKKIVCKFRSEVMPWRLSVCLFAHSVLELPAGTIRRTSTRPGDQFRFEFAGESSDINRRECLSTRAGSL